MKLIEDVTCPNCKKDFTKETDLDKLQKADPVQSTNVSTSGQTQILEQKPKVIEKEVIKTVIEDFKPGYECPDGDCEIGIHKNKNYSKRVKGKCTNCDQFTKQEKGKCPWCKKEEIEPIEKEELEDLGIEMPIIDEHEGHLHE